MSSYDKIIVSQHFSFPLSEFKGVALPPYAFQLTPLATGDGAWFTIETVEV